MDSRINPIKGLTNTLLPDNKGKQIDGQGTPFSDVLKNALSQVVDDIKTADELSKQLAVGEVKDLHQVTLAMEKADLGLQLTVQVRNKVVEAYQEIMRMQV